VFFVKGHEGVEIETVPLKLETRESWLREGITAHLLTKQVEQSSTGRTSLKLDPMAVPLAKMN